MCKYCNLLSGDRIILAEDGEIELKIEKHNKDYSLVAEGLTDIAETRINYCPMCGRKLIEQYMNILATNDMLHVKECEEKDKIIDLMLDYISNVTDCPFESERKYLDCERMCGIRTDKECWKQYFENKAKELINK